MLSRLVMRCSSNLYTWGGSPSSLGHEVSGLTNSIPLPTPMDIGEPIAKCVLGSNHSAIIATSGNIYTFGSGTSGVLGHDSENKSVLPRRIESLAKLEIKVKDVAIGSYHTVILTTEGEVWTMGYGGTLAGGLLRRMFSQSGGGLGHGDLKDRFVPSLVMILKDHEDIVQVTAGSYHTLALGASGQLYVWGKGEMGVLGTGRNSTILDPTPNTYFRRMLDEDGSRAVKIVTSNYSNLALMDSGKVYGWGWNEVGQLGTGNFARADMYEIEAKPLLVAFFEDMKVKDIKLGEDCSTFLTEDNRVFFSGNRLYRGPKELNVPKDAKVRSIFAMKKVGGYITGNF